MNKAKKNIYLMLTVLVMVFLSNAIKSNYLATAEENWMVDDGDILEIGAMTLDISSPSAIETPEAPLPTEEPPFVTPPPESYEELPKPEPTPIIEAPTASTDEDLTPAITSTPEPIETAIPEPTPIIEAPIASPDEDLTHAITPTPEPIETAIPEPTPIIEAPTASPDEDPTPAITPTPEPIETVMPEPTPIIEAPTASPGEDPTPAITPTPEPIETVMPEPTPIIEAPTASPDEDPTPAITPTPEPIETVTPEINEEIAQTAAPVIPEEVFPSNLIYLEDPCEELISPAALDVYLPDEVPFLIIIPKGSSGKGQIYSEEYFIYNYSNTDVLISCSAIQYSFINETDFRSLESPDGIDDITDAKAIYMTMRSSDMNEEDEDIVIRDTEHTDVRTFLLKASNFSDSGEWESFNDDSMASFWFSGNVNTKPHKKWLPDDVKVKLVFSYGAVEDGSSYEPDYTP